MSWNLKKEAVDIITASSIPSVYVGPKNAREFDVFSVGIDHEKAGYDVGRYLLTKENEDIMFISPTIPLRQ